LPATYRELHHKEAAVTIPRLGPGQDAAMPPKDRHGKNAQDYRAALIAELDAVPDYRRRRKAQRSPLLFVWLPVPLPSSVVWLGWLWVWRWPHPNALAELSTEALNSHVCISLPTSSAPATCQATNLSYYQDDYVKRLPRDI